VTEIITAKGILEDLIRHLTRAPKLFVSPVEKWLVITSGFGLGWFGGVVLLVRFKAIPPWLAYSALVSVLGAAVLLMLMPWATLAPSLLRRLAYPEKAELEPVIRSFNDEVDLISHLTQTYARHQLEYAQDRVALAITRTRSWNALWFGAIEKVGVLPLAVAAYFSWRKLPVNQTYAVSELLSTEVIIAGALVFFYLLAVIQQATCLKLDGFGLVLRHAVQAKKSADPSPNAAAPPVDVPSRNGGRTAVQAPLRPRS
jgi:hypothetical protein